MVEFENLRIGNAAIDAFSMFEEFCKLVSIVRDNFYLPGVHARPDTLLILYVAHLIVQPSTVLALICVAILRAAVFVKFRPGLVLATGAAAFGLHGYSVACDVAHMQVGYGSL